MWPWTMNWTVKAASPISTLHLHCRPLAVVWPSRVCQINGRDFVRVISDSEVILSAFQHKPHHRPAYSVLRPTIICERFMLVASGCEVSKFSWLVNRAVPPKRRSRAIALRAGWIRGCGTHGHQGMHILKAKSISIWDIGMKSVDTAKALLNSPP